MNSIARIKSLFRKMKCRCGDCDGQGHGRHLDGPRRKWIFISDRELRHGAMEKSESFYVYKRLIDAGCPIESVESWAFGYPNITKGPYNMMVTYDPVLRESRYEWDL